MLAVVFNSDACRSGVAERHVQMVTQLVVAAAHSDALSQCHRKSEGLAYLGCLFRQKSDSLGSIFDDCIENQLVLGIVHQLVVLFLREICANKCVVAQSCLQLNELVVAKFVQMVEPNLSNLEANILKRIAFKFF